MNTAITLPVEQLKPALLGLGKIIDKKSSIPGLTCVRIDRDTDGWIVLSGSDGDTFASVRLEQPEHGQPATIIIPLAELAAIVKACSPRDTITVDQARDGEAIVQYPIGNTTGERRVESFRPSECPPLPMVKGSSLPVEEKMRDSILEAMECASLDESRLILNGAFIDVSDKNSHYVIATDGRHLFSSNSFHIPLENSFLMPSHKFVSWKGFVEDGRWQLTVEQREKDVPLIQIRSRRWTFVQRGIDGNYPNWKQVIPDKRDVKTMVRLSEEAIATALKLIPQLPCHEEVNHSVGLKVDGGHLILRGRSVGESNWTEVNLESVSVNGNPITVALNREYLSKALRFGLNIVEIIDATSPVKFSSDGRQMIVMPIRVTDGEPVAPAQADDKPATPERKMTMTTPSTNPSEATSPEAKTALDKAVGQVETVKATVKSAVAQLNELLDTIKQIHREQKVSEKEVASVRATLEKLQNVRI